MMTTNEIHSKHMYTYAWHYTLQKLHTLLKIRKLVPELSDLEESFVTCGIPI